MSRAGVLMKEKSVTTLFMLESFKISRRWTAYS